MKTFQGALRLGGSTIAALALLTAANAAFAQEATQDAVTPSVGSGQDTPDNNADIVVTGSSIRGVAPVGSNLVSVGQEAILKVAPTSVSELVNTVPAITTAGATPQGQNAYSYYSPQIHSLAGSGSNTTLAIIDGMRMPGGGLQFGQTDPNIIPTSALQRVEVLADGASSIYGSDAVAGVVNFITRKSYEGLEINGRAGWGDRYSSYDLNGIWGTKWETGNVYVASQFTRQSALANDKRDYISRGNYTDFGGTNTNQYTCSPATIRTTASGSAYYLSPSATTTTPGTTANAPCNTSIYGTAIPGVQRENLLVVLNQDFGDRFTFTGKMNYNHLQTWADGTPGTLTNVTAFGPGSNRGGQINPFYQAPAGEPGATQQTVSWLALTPDGNYGQQTYENDTIYLTGKLEYKLTDSWTVTLSDALGRSRSRGLGEGVFCSACAVLALNGTTQSNGSTTASSVAGQNIVVLNLPLTTSNALDVWNPVGSNKTSATVYKQLYSNYTLNEHENNFNQTKLEVQGELFDLPAGKVRMAAGGEYMWLQQNIKTSNPANFGTTTVGSQYISTRLKRNVYSGYLEFYVPVISEEMNVPLVQAFDVSISGRYDHYSDFGSTSNPKFAANWKVNDWIKLRGNYAKSFVAPPLNQIGDPTRGYIRSATGTSTSVAISVPFALYPEVRGVPGCQTETGPSCLIGGSTNPGLDRSLGAGFSGVKPQKGSSWSVGVDLNPTWLPGFTANVTYWSNTFIGGVASPSQPLIINSAALHDRLTICPQGCTAQQVYDFTNVANGATVGGTIPATVYFLINRDTGNVLNLHVQGIDAQAQYRLETKGIGAFTIGASMTYFTKFDQDFGDDPFSVLNTSGYNSQFPSIQKKGRGQLSWEYQDFAIDFFANWTGAYRNWINTSKAPIITDARGNPIGGGDRVRSDLNFDMHAAYNFNGNFLNGSQVYVDVKNIFNRNPPFYNGNTTGVGVGAWGFNGFTSNIIGRVVSVGFRAKFW